MQGTDDVRAPVRSKGNEMKGQSREKKPTAFIAIGVCFMSAGVALSIALHSRGASGAGSGLIGVGVMFLIIGAARKRKLESDESAGEEKIGTDIGPSGRQSDGRQSDGQ